MLPRLEKNGGLPSGDDRADGDSSAQSFGQGDDVGDDARGQQVVGHPGAGASHSGLDLIDDEQRAGGLGQLAGRLQVSGGQLTHPGLALNGFDDECRHIRPQRGAQGLDVAGGDELDSSGQRLEGLAVGGLVGQGQRAHGPAVEGVLEGQDAGAPAPAVAAGDLEGGLIGLGAGVGQEDAGVVSGTVGEGEPDELLGEADLGGGGEEVRHVPQLGELLGDGPDDRGVRMAQAVDGDACQQVDVLLTVGVPDVGVPPPDQDPARGAEGVHDGVGVARQPAGVAGAGPLRLRSGCRCLRGVGHRLLPPFSGGTGASPGWMTVPTPWSVTISSSMLWAWRPSTTCACPTPP